MTIVSNSNMETFQRCQRMFYYSVVQNLTPKQMSTPIRRGSFGHKCMELGMEVLMNGGSLEEATEAAYGPVTEMMQSGDPAAAEIIYVARHVAAFLAYFHTNPNITWRPVALEEVGLWDLNNDVPIERDQVEDYHLVYAYTPDIIIEFIKGPFKGQFGVLDYKFLGQYMSQDTIDMSVQIPKYIIYRSKIRPEQRLRRGAFVQFNTRATPTDTGHKLFLIKWIEPEKAELAEIERENKALAYEVAKARYIDEPQVFLRTQNKDVCGRCWFKEICHTERRGKDATHIIERDFKQNDYGY